MGRGLAVSPLSPKRYGKRYEGRFLSRKGPDLRILTHRRDKRCMLVSSKSGADFSRGCAHPARRARISATHPHLSARKNRSPIGRAPARRRSLGALPWTALRLRVDVNHHLSGARAPLAGYPRTALHTSKKYDIIGESMRQAGEVVVPCSHG
jgi:hypothetical protein